MTPHSLSDFAPAENTRAFRSALGAFATGVTVVTTVGTEGPVGITANSFASVSLDPPLVLWSPARASRRFAAFEAAESFAIHVLSADQQPLCDAFTRSGAPFDAVDWVPGLSGVPVLTGVLSVFECVREAVHDGGDHAIVLGRVVRAATRAGDPLVFHAGRYGSFRDAD